MPRPPPDMILRADFRARVLMCGVGMPLIVHLYLRRLIFNCEFSLFDTQLGVQSLHALSPTVYDVDMGFRVRVLTCGIRTPSVALRLGL